MQTEDLIAADFGVVKNGIGMYGQKTISYKNEQYDKPEPEEVYKGLDYQIKEDAGTKTEEFWNENRHQQLTVTEKGVYHLVDTLKQIPLFRRIMEGVALGITGYVNFRDVEIGPVGTFYGFNPVEGNRVKFGGRSTTLFSKKITLEGYGAYGFKDKRYKYFGGL